MSAALSVRQRSALASLIALAAGVGAVFVAAPAPADTGADSSSAVTKSGTGVFSGLKVTVNQTQHLLNQVVQVSWSGGTQTQPTVGTPAIHYLQIMQCWGDGAAPVRENCEFGADDGGLIPAYGGVGNVVSRQLGPDTKDATPNIYDPFVPVSGPPTTDFPSAYFDLNTSNEVPFARTSADGTGKAFFELQNSALSPGLGCGGAESNGTIRNCWLVVVPRDNHEVDGTTVSQLISSPLSQTNWNNAISFRMNFDPVDANCAAGAAERRLVGQESASEAISRWQPALCASAGSTFGFSQIADRLARSQTQQSDPWLGFVSQPVDPATIADGRRMTYAPVALSGIGIAFNIDQEPIPYKPPASAVAVAGQRAETLNLNARLVAKLLTQSYSTATFADGFPVGNPQDLLSDPEFKALNPAFTYLQVAQPVNHILVPEGLADAYSEVWSWIQSDADAKAFLNGTPDGWGMVVNPAWQGKVGTPDRFPLMDGSCLPLRPGIDLSPTCTSDKLPYSSDMHGGSRAAARGNTLVSGAPAQLAGQREVLTLADTATARRYSLPMANLVNASGKLVAANDSGITAGYNSMTASSLNSSVLVPNPASTDPAAYPLTHLTYAATSPDHLQPDEADAYARFLTFVTGPGQTPGIAPGQLPPGYVPLPQKLVDQAWGAVKTILAGPVAQPAGGSSSAAASDAAAGSGSFADAVASLTGAIDRALGLPGAGGSALAAQAPAATPVGAAKASGGAPPTKPTSFATPTDSAGAAQFGVVVALGLALIAGLAWLGLPMLARRGPPTT